ncbi:MAG: hypothetical protein ACK5UX_09655, partial [Burkholderiales bacterium]
MPAASDSNPAGHDKRAYVVFEQAEFVVHDALTPPPADAKWSIVDLPDSWRQQGRAVSKLGWYRFRFRHSGAQHTGSGTGQRAIYITRITNNMEVFLNGSSFAVSGRLGPQPEESWNLAQFHFVPPSLIREGENELLIRLHPDGYPRAGLSQVYLGDSSALRPLFNLRYFIQTTAPQLITGVLVVMCIFSLRLWMRRRSETMFLLFGLMTAVAVVRLFHHYLRDTPPWLMAAAVPAMCWLTVLQTAFAFHYAKRPQPHVEKRLYWFAASCTAMLLIAALTGWYNKATGIVY